MNVKKLFLFLIAFFSLIGCSKNSSDNHQVLVNQNDIKITFLELSDQYTDDGVYLGGPSLKLKIEAEKLRDNYQWAVMPHLTAVNDVMVNAYLQGDTEVIDEHTEIVQIVLPNEELTEKGIEAIEEVDISFILQDPEKVEIIDITEPVEIKLSSNESKYVFDSSGFVVHDKDGVKVVVKNTQKSETTTDSNVFLYIENNTDKELRIDFTNITLNGEMCEFILNHYVFAGNKFYDDIPFKNITKDNLLEISFKITAYDTETLDIITQTDYLRLKVIEDSFELFGS